MSSCKLTLKPVIIGGNSKGFIIPKRLYNLECDKTYTLEIRRIDND